MPIDKRDVNRAMLSEARGGKMTHAMHYVYYLPYPPKENTTLTSIDVIIAEIGKVLAP